MPSGTGAQRDGKERACSSECVGGKFSEVDLHLYAVLISAGVPISQEFRPDQVLRMASSCRLAEHVYECDRHAAAQQNAREDNEENAVEDRLAFGVVLVLVVERQKPAEQSDAAR